MRFSAALFTGLFASTVLAAPHLVVRQSNDDSPDDAVLYSPANGTSIQPGQTFNFTYLADDDDTVAVRLALTQVVTVGCDLAIVPTCRKSITKRDSALLSCPEGTTPLQDQMVGDW